MNAEAKEMITVRAATLADHELILTVLQRAVVDSRHSLVDDENGARRYLHKVILKHLTLVASAHGRVVGLVIGEVGSEEWSNTPFLDVRIMWIEPAFRGSRIAYEFFMAINSFADLNGLEVALGVAGAQMSERMIASKGIRGEYEFVGGYFVRRQRREEKGS